MAKFGPTRAATMQKNQAGCTPGESTGRAKMGKLSSSPKRSPLTGGFGFSKSMTKFVEGASAGMRPVEAVIRELAQSDVPVLLLAEQGAGKHTIAQRIHDLSRRNAQPFRWYQCSTVKPEDLQSTPADNRKGAGTIFCRNWAN